MNGESSNGAKTERLRSMQTLWLSMHKIANVLLMCALCMNVCVSSSLLIVQLVNNNLELIIYSAVVVQIWLVTENVRPLHIFFLVIVFCINFCCCFFLSKSYSKSNVRKESSRDFIYIYTVRFFFAVGLLLFVESAKQNKKEIISLFDNLICSEFFNFVCNC